MSKRATDEYQNVFERFLAHDRDITPLLNGIANKEAAIRAHRAAHQFNASKATKEHIAELIRKYD